MARFRKKPVVIEAFQLGIDYIPDWFMDKVTTNDIILHGTSSGFEHHDDINADIKTLEGWHHANFGDFIIKGTAGEIYPCKPHIFKDIYESADTTADVAPKSEVDRLEYTLLGVMHSVDKWLDGDELKQDEVNRAATMREKTLRIIENAKTEVAREIFAEIETCLYQPFDDIPDDPHYQICQQDYEAIKKTYTEGKE